MAMHMDALQEQNDEVVYVVGERDYSNNSTLIL